MAMSKEESPLARPGGRRPMRCRCRSPRSRCAVLCIHPPPLPRIHGAINTSPEIHSFRSPRRRIIILSAQLKRAPHHTGRKDNTNRIDHSSIAGTHLHCVALQLAGQCQFPWKRE
nr:unnamed protein product [Digitaria exilis]